MSATARLAGFVLLLALAFAVARMAGERVGPVTTGHSQVRCTGCGPGGPGTGGMNMGGRP